ncbi:MAG: hypothetical protein QG656_1544, partial [Candidatus Hydrogenedentes bacterium]|nr:hypothetical protein [Candidatus Hydrogenedentota bacterium]
RRFRWSVALTALAVIGVAAAVSFFFDAALAKGILIGGVAASVMFLLWTRMAENVLSGNPGSGFAMIPLPFVRLAVYALVLWKAHSFDPEGWMGFTGAVAGLSVVYVVVAVIGYVGPDLREVPK